MEKIIKFELAENEAAFIIQVIGNLPTHAGAHPLYLKLQDQVKQQIPQPVVE